MARPDLDLRDWFSEHELQLCPCCNLPTALRTPSGGFHICLDCGLIKPDGRRVGDLRTPTEEPRAPRAA